MKKLIFTIFGLTAALFSQAQTFLPDGTTITSTASFKDINNVSYDLFTLCNQGKHVIIDLSATWCGPCWSYHSTHVLDNYYDMYGPTGTNVNKDAAVFLYEVDPTTTLADVNGTTSGTQGNWTTGTSHPICNEASTGGVVGKFLNPGTTSYGVPAVFVICSNKKLYQLSTSMTNVTNLRNYIASKCTLAPANVGDLQEMGFSYQLAPNPATGASHLNLNLETGNDVTITVKNLLGENVYTTNRKNMTIGEHKIELPLNGQAAGMYLVQLQVGERNVTMKLMLN